MRPAEQALEAHLAWSSGHDADRGLLGFVTIKLAGRIMLDGIALRRNATGRLCLSFPERRDSCGRRHPYIRPVDDQARRDLEAQVFAALGLEDLP